MSESEGCNHCGSCNKRKKKNLTKSEYIKKTDIKVTLLVNYDGKSTCT